MTSEHYKRQSLPSIRNLCWNIKLHVRETDWKVVKGLLKWIRLIPVFFPQTLASISYCHNSLLQPRILTSTGQPFLSHWRWDIVTSELHCSHIYTVFAFRSLTRLIAGWCWSWINSATTSWSSKVAHILSVQEHPSEVSEWATIYLEIASFEACNLSKRYIFQSVSQATYRIST